MDAAPEAGRFAPLYHWTVGLDGYNRAPETYFSVRRRKKKWSRLLTRLLSDRPVKRLPSHTELSEVIQVKCLRIDWDVMVTGTVALWTFCPSLTTQVYSPESVWDACRIRSRVPLTCNRPLKHSLYLSRPRKGPASGVYPLLHGAIAPPDAHFKFSDYLSERLQGVPAFTTRGSTTAIEHTCRVALKFCLWFNI